MRNASRRSFTVEVKSSGRRRSAIIPSREAAPPLAPPVPAWPELAKPAAAAAAPAVEARRILPNLIVPDEPAAPEPTPLDEAPRRPRGRPRKPRPTPIEPLAGAFENAGPASPELPEPPLQAPQERSPERTEPPLSAGMARKPKPAKTGTAPALDLARGERWKRRLGRWSR